MAKSDLEQRLTELPADQFAAATQAFEAAKSARRLGGNDPELARNLANMSPGEFEAAKSKLLG